MQTQSHACITVTAPLPPAKKEKAAGMAVIGLSFDLATRSSRQLKASYNSSLRPHTLAAEGRMKKKKAAGMAVIGLSFDLKARELEVSDNFRGTRP